MWKRMLSYAAKGDAWFSAVDAGATPSHLVSKADASGLASAMRKLGASATLSAAPYAEMLSRLHTLADVVDEAAASLS